MKAKVAVVFVLILLLTTGFFGLDYVLLAQDRYYDISVSLDRWIPLSPVWIWAYLLYYPLCLIPPLLPPVLRDTRLFVRVLGGFLVQFAVAWPIFYFFPTRIVHPLVSGMTPSDLAVQGLYRVDAGYCIFPCLHVANSLYAALVMRRYLPARWHAPLFLVVGLITASTLLIKQHLFVDVVGGVILGFSAYAFFRASLGVGATWPERRPAVTASGQPQTAAEPGFRGTVATPSE